MVITDKYVFFYGRPSIFSNWERRVNQFKDPLNGNLTFNSSEQNFMWWKAVFFQDNKIATLLETETDPATTKRLGRQITNFDPVAWGCVAQGFMNYVLYLKFSQNEDYKKILKDTGNRILVEASPTDKIWGIGLGIDNPDIYDESKWQGTNLLGKSLMYVRNIV